MKILITLVLLNFSWITAIHGKTLIYGPNTPIYFAELVAGYLKVDMRKNSLPSSEAKYQNDVIHPKMLMIYDYKDVAKHGKQACINRAKRTVSYINSYYEKLNSNPKIEVVLSGVVLIMNEKILPRPSTFQVPQKDFLTSTLLTEKYIIQAEGTGEDFRDFTLATTDLGRISEWMKNNADQLESLDYNFFLYSFPWYMATDASPDVDKHLVMGLSQGQICSSNPGVLINNLVGDEHRAYPLEISYLLGVSHAMDKPDSHYYTSNFDFYEDEQNEWSKQTANAITAESKKNSFYCTKEEEPDYDYES